MLACIIYRLYRSYPCEYISNNRHLPLLDLMVLVLLKVKTIKSQQVHDNNVWYNVYPVF